MKEKRGYLTVAVKLASHVLEKLLNMLQLHPEEVERYAAHIDLYPLFTAPQLLYQASFFRIPVSQPLTMKSVYEPLNVRMRFLQAIIMHYGKQKPLARGLYTIGTVALKRNMDFDEFKVELDKEGHHLAPPIYQAAFANVLAPRIGEQEILSFDVQRRVVYALYREQDQQLTLRIDLPNFWKRDRKKVVPATRLVLILRKEDFLE
jgi:hypothetical protein